MFGAINCFNQVKGFLPGQSIFGWSCELCYVAVAFLSQCNAEWDAVCMHLYWHWGVWLSNGGIAEFRWLLSSFLSNPGKGHHSYRVRGRRCERVTVLVQEGRSKKVRTCAVARERGTQERHLLLFGIVQPWTAQLPAEPVQSQKHTPISAISAEI